MTDNLQYVDDFFSHRIKQYQESTGYDDNESRVAEISDSVSISDMGCEMQNNATAVSRNACLPKYFSEDTCSCERHHETSDVCNLPELTSISGHPSLANTCTMPTYVHTTPTGLEDEDEGMKQILPYDEYQNHIPFSSDHSQCDNEKDRTMATVNYSDDDSLWSLEMDVEKLFRMSRQGCLGRESRETHSTVNQIDRYPPTAGTETKMRKEALKIAQLLCAKSSSDLIRKKISSSTDSEGNMTANNVFMEQTASNQINNLRDTIEEELSKQGEQRSKNTKMSKSYQNEQRHHKRIKSEHLEQPTVSEQTPRHDRSKSDPALSLSTIVKKPRDKISVSTKDIKHYIQTEGVAIKPKAKPVPNEEEKSKSVVESVHAPVIDEVRTMTITTNVKNIPERSQSAYPTPVKPELKQKSKSCVLITKSTIKLRRSASEGKAKERKKLAVKDNTKESQKALSQRNPRGPFRTKSSPKRARPAGSPGRQNNKAKFRGDAHDRSESRSKTRKKCRSSLSRDKEKKLNTGKTKIAEKDKTKMNNNAQKRNISAQKRNNARKTNEKSKVNDLQAITSSKKPSKPISKQNHTKPKSPSKQPVKSENKSQMTKKTHEVDNKHVKKYPPGGRFSANQLRKRQPSTTPTRNVSRVNAAGDSLKREVRPKMAASLRKGAQSAVAQHRKKSVEKIHDRPAWKSSTKVVRTLPKINKPQVLVSVGATRKSVGFKEKPVERPMRKPATTARLKMPVTRPTVSKPRPTSASKVTKEPVNRRVTQTPSSALTKRPTSTVRGKSADEIRRQKLRQAIPKPPDKRLPKSKSEPRLLNKLPVKPAAPSQRSRLCSRSKTRAAAREKGDTSMSSDDFVSTPMFVTPFNLKECYEIIQKQQKHSYTREALTSEVVALYNGQRTKMGCELVHCIAGNVHDPSESCPRISDSKCIDKFQSFFYPLLFKLFRKTYSQIEEIFRQPEMKTAVSAANRVRATPLELMPLRWAFLPANYLQKYRFLKNYVVSIDLEIHRNIDGYRIGDAMRLEERHDLQIRLTKALFDFDNDGVSSCLDNSKVVELRRHLKKYHRFHSSETDTTVITCTPLGQSVYCSVAEDLNYASHVAAWLNLDDHLLLATLNESFERINIVLDTLNTCSTVILENLSAKSKKMGKLKFDIESDFATPITNTFMIHPIFGYVTSNPKHLGTGCQLRFLVRIPYIGHLPDIDDVTRDFVDLKAVPFDTEHPDQELFYVFSECCFNTSEAAMITTTSERTAAFLRVEKAMKKCNPRFPEEAMMPVEPLRYLYRKMNNAIFERPHNLHSLTWKCLNSSLVEQSISLFTSYGGSLAHCIRLNAYHPAETLPRACDAEAYTLFSEFFNRILSEINQGEIREHLCEPDEKFREEDFAALDFEHPKVLSYKLQFVRNVKGFAFSPIITATSRRIVEMKLLSQLNSLKHDLLGSYHTLQELTNDCEAFLDALREESNGELRPDMFAINTACLANKCAGCFRNWPTSRGVYYLTQRPQDTDTAIWINTTDHFKLVAVANKLSNAYSVCRRILVQLEHTCPDGFAKTSSNGYLTFCPNEVGNGMQVSARVSLPFLAKKMDLFQQLCQKQQLDIRPVVTDNQFDIQHTSRIGKISIESATEFLHNLKELIHLDHSFEMLETI